MIYGECLTEQSMNEQDFVTQLLFENFQYKIILESNIKDKINSILKFLHDLLIRVKKELKEFIKKNF